MSKQIFNFVLVSVLIFLNINCSKKGHELTLTQEQQIKEIGEASAMALMKNLKQHLMEALNSGDTAEAVEFCSAQAIPLTEQAQATLQPGVQIKRTSFKVRNPQNAPDQYEQEVLKQFELLIEQGKSLTQFYIQKIPEKTEYRYYKPMTVSKICLKCHGDPEDMEAVVKKVLIENYPGDNAIGYKIDDFRGLIRVSIPAELIEK